MGPPSSAPRNADGRLAASFYGLHPVLIPYGSAAEILQQQLRKVQPDVLIAEAGTMELQPVLSGCHNLSQVIWVTKPGNKHMDFTDGAENVEGKVKSSTWHDLVEEYKSPANSGVPTIERGSQSPSLSIVEPSSDSALVVEYTSEVSYYLRCCVTYLTAF